MLLTDIIHHYKPFDQFVAHCRLRIYQHQEQVVVVVTEMVDNKEISITSYWPELAHEIAEQHSLSLANTLWIEHYPKAEYALAGERGDTFDLLNLSNELPEWRRLTREEVQQLIGETLAQSNVPE